MAPRLMHAARELYDEIVRASPGPLARWLDDPDRRDWLTDRIATMLVQAAFAARGGWARAPKGWKRLDIARSWEFDNAWREHTPAEYIAPDGTGATIGTRYDDFGNWLTDDRRMEGPVRMPTVTLDAELRPTFADGRHRWAFLRNHGVQLAVAVPAAQWPAAHARWGQKARRTVGPVALGARTIYVVVRDDGSRQAFYRSTGTGGYTAAGDWVPFFGFTELHEAHEQNPVPWLAHPWFVKGAHKDACAQDWDDFEVCEDWHYLQAEEQAGRLPSIAEHAWPDTNEHRTLAGQRLIMESGGAMNRWLRSHGALDTPLALRYRGARALIGIDKTWGQLVRWLRTTALDPRDMTITTRRMVDVWYEAKGAGARGLTR